MKYYAIGIDLAKNIFQVCGVNQRLKSLFNKKVKRKEFLAFMALLEPTDVYMEACYSSHYWSRKLKEIGHNPNLIPAQHVKPFVRGNKNDHNDAVAIIEASQRPFIKFVPTKTEHQQEISSLHRIRERLVKSKTAVSNQARGLLSEFGVVFDQGQEAFCKGMKAFVSDDSYSARLRSLMADQFREYNELLVRIKAIEKELNWFIEVTPSGKILMSIPGIGIIIASAILAAIDKGQAFNNPREFAVWLGLTPQLYASGDKSKMGSITKRGDRYLRKQLIHGARAVVCHAKNKPDQLNVWACKLRENKSFNKTTVAMAHRLARLVWILLQRQELYRPQSCVH